jgi:malonyl-CoA/methylmalonyl-CoA synthetase
MHRYWKKPTATKETFDEQGWFKTGDVATVVDGYYKILGRASVDIIKSAGYKISALDIERELLEHPDIHECAVVGLEDEQYGQKIVAILVQKQGTTSLTVDTLKSWAKSRLAPYKIPRMLVQLHQMPRNAMGKVNKKDLIKTVLLHKQQ